MHFRILFSFILIFHYSIFCYGQQKSDPADLRVVNRQLYFKKGDSTPLVIHLNSGPGAGIAWLSGSSFSKGIIEFDAKGKDVLQQSFVGIAFHGENDSTYEAIYFRPFNFRSKDSARRLHAVQYIASPNYDWPKLRNDFPNQYEKPIIPPPEPEAWFHVKIVVSENQILVFVNRNTKPCLVVKPIVHLQGKSLGYWVGNGSDGDWKNLVIQ